MCKGLTLKWVLKVSCACMKGFMQVKNKCFYRECLDLGVFKVYMYVLIYLCL